MRARPALAALLLLVASPAVASAEDEPPASRREAIATELAVSAGATMFLAPATYSAARFVGTATPNLNTSALPALVLATLLPPAIATGALAFQRQRAGETTRLLRPFLFSTAAQALVLTGAFFAKTWVASTSDLLLLSATTGVVGGGAATLGAEISF